MAQSRLYRTIPTPKQVIGAWQSRAGWVAAKNIESLAALCKTLEPAELDASARPFHSYLIDK
jgi:hypothetical protein